MACGAGGEPGLDHRRADAAAIAASADGPGGVAMARLALSATDRSRLGRWRRQSIRRGRRGRRAPRRWLRRAGAHRLARGARLAVLVVALTLLWARRAARLDPDARALADLPAGRPALGAAASDLAAARRQPCVMSEDARFCQHRRRRLGRAPRGHRGCRGRRPRRGASTLTMQTAKNLFLWPSRSYIRKGLEIPLALWLDLVLVQAPRPRGLPQHRRVGPRRVRRRGGGAGLVRQAGAPP